MALQGTLDTFALPDVLRLLASTHKTGQLSVTTERGRGELCLAHGELSGARFGDARELPAVDVMFELLRSEGGSFAFDTEPPSDSWSEACDVEPVLRDAETMLAEWHEVVAVVPSMRCEIHLVEELGDDQVTVGRDQWRQLAAIGSGSTPEELGSRFGLGELSAARAVKALVGAGLVVVGAELAEEEHAEALAEDEIVAEEEVPAEEELPAEDQVPAEAESVADVEIVAADEAVAEEEAATTSDAVASLDRQLTELEMLAKAFEGTDPLADTHEGYAPLSISVPDAPEPLLDDAVDEPSRVEAPEPWQDELSNPVAVASPERADLPEPLPGGEPLDRFALFGDAPAPSPVLSSPAPAELPDDLTALSPDAARAVAAVMESQGGPQDAPEVGAPEPVVTPHDAALAEPVDGSQANRGLLLRLLGPNRS